MNSFRLPSFGTPLFSDPDLCPCASLPSLRSCVASKLQELNSMVTVKVASGKLTEDVVGAHGVVVMCGQPAEEVVKWDAFCHEKVHNPNSTTA